jgi:hypothetical protein
MASVVASIGIVLQNIFSVFTGMGAYLPPGTWMVLMVMLVVGIIVGISLYVSKQPTVKSTLESQLALYQAPYDSLSTSRQGIDDYLARPEVQASQGNWVLLNFAPLTLMNAGYAGPYMNGVYDPQTIRQALDLGFRAFKFHIDFYTGSNKKHFGALPGEPCLLHRDDNGIIRSLNAGRLSEMIAALDEQAFSPSLPTGNDPLIVILDFKNTPDPVQTPEPYKRFLSAVSKQIQPLRRTLLTQLGESYFNNLQNQNLLFTQNFQSLRKKTLIFTNADTTCFTKATSVPTTEENLRMMIHAQVYTMDGGSAAGLTPPDTVTQAAPSGTQMAIGKQAPSYYLNTPETQLTAMQNKTNNTYALVDSGSQNVLDANQYKLMTTYGVQMVPFFLYNTPAETLSMFKAWGPYSWKLKPAALQYIVVKTVPPAKLSQAANAQGGNVSPPALHL